MGQGEPGLCCARRCPALPALPPELPQNSRVGMANAAFTAGRSRDTSGLLPTELWKGDKVWSLPGMAELAQDSHDPISSISLQLAGPDLLRAGYKQCQEKALCEYSGHTLLLQGHCSTRSWAAPLLQMLLGSKERISSAQAVVAESELKEIEFNQECCPGVFTESLAFGRAERRQQSQKWRKEKENQWGFHIKRLGKGAMLTKLH